MRNELLGIWGRKDNDVLGGKLTEGYIKKSIKTRLTSCVYTVTLEECVYACLLKAAYDAQVQVII